MMTDEEEAELNALRAENRTLHTQLSMLKATAAMLVMDLEYERRVEYEDPEEGDRISMAKDGVDALAKLLAALTSTPFTLPATTPTTSDHLDTVLAKLPSGIFTLRDRVEQILHVLTCSRSPVIVAAIHVVTARNRLVMQIIRDGGTGMKYAELDSMIDDLEKAIREQARRELPRHSF
jgi:hypothetical protein